MNVQRTKYAMVVYVPDVGTRPIGRTEFPIHDKVLLLHSNGGNDIGYPQTLCLDKAVVDEMEVWVMNKEQFTTAITAKGQLYSYPTSCATWSQHW